MSHRFNSAKYQTEAKWPASLPPWRPQGRCSRFAANPDDEPSGPVSDPSERYLHTMPSRSRNRIAAVALTAALLFAVSGGVAQAAALGPRLAAGGGHTCAILAAGHVKCWGDNGSGQLGDGTTIDRTAPARVREVAHAVAIAAGDGHSCAVIANGRVKCWGNDYSGQLGNGARHNRSRPVSVRGIADAVGIAAGDGFSCALLSSGGVKCWGRGADGQLGDASGRTNTTPVRVRQLTGAVQISSAGDHTCALLAGGSVECWGSDPYGQLGDIATRPIPIRGIVGATAVAAGGGAIPDKIAENNSEYSCAIVDSGQVWCWGDNRAGQLGDGTTTTSATPVWVSGVEGATQLTAGAQHACALVSTGAIECWGDDRGRARRRVHLGPLHRGPGCRPERRDGRRSWR